jgi:hypothetical protein
MEFPVFRIYDEERCLVAAPDGGRLGMTVKIVQPLIAD